MPKNPRPRFSAATARSVLNDRFGVDGALDEVASERDRNFRVRSADGDDYVVKFANATERRSTLELQNAALEHLARHHASSTGRTWPRVHPDRAGRTIVEVTDDGGEVCLTRLLDWIPGRPLAQALPHDHELMHQLGRFVGGMDRAFASFDHPAARRALQWDLLRGEGVVADNLHRIASDDRRDLIRRRLDAFRLHGAPLLDHLPRGVIHNDANDYNVLVHGDAGTRPRVCAVIDLGDMLHSLVVGDLAIALAYAMMGKADPLETAAAVTRGYVLERPLVDAEIEALHDLVCLRLATSVTLAAGQTQDEPDNAYLGISERPAWDLLRRLDELPRPLARHVYRDAAGRTPGDGRPFDPTFGSIDPAPLRESRRRRLGPSLSLSYDEPLTIVRGWMQYLFAEDGRRYLDAVNNVCHVGHCHPRVVESMRRQAATLNTNTRYLHPLLTRYAERLTALFPDPLSVCYLVNSGSEANDLALRLARTFTGRTDSIVLEGAYHGNVSSTVAISPYKFDGPGGSGVGAGVRVVPMPDPYRGRYRGDDPTLGARYARHVADAARDDRGGPAAFICESLLGCGGQVVLPDGYLAAAFRQVRAAGGVTIADEVQVGFGRIGSHRWGFEAQGVVPDIVTLGKPIGNGHPLAAVVTTPEIADAFDNGMEYFNTFGGNPVSCAVGLAVLDAIEQDGLQRHALDVGHHLLAELRRCATRHPTIGDVRGMGLFVGVELVRNAETRQPATREAHAAVQACRQAGVLLSTDGPDHNVIKIKPPLPFSREDADRLVETLDVALAGVVSHPG